jgi:hypothetical protein
MYLCTYTHMYKCIYHPNKWDHKTLISEVHNNLIWVYLLLAWYWSYRNTVLLSVFCMWNWRSGFVYTVTIKCTWHMTHSTVNSTITVTVLLLHVINFWFNIHSLLSQPTALHPFLTTSHCTVGADTVTFSKPQYDPHRITQISQFYIPIDTQMFVNDLYNRMSLLNSAYCYTKRDIKTTNLSYTEHSLSRPAVRG